MCGWQNQGGDHEPQEVGLAGMGTVRNHHLIAAIIQFGITLAGLGASANSFATLYDSLVWGVVFVIFAWVGALILARQRYDEGLSMTDVLKMANDSKAGEVVVLLDCCNSGHMGGVPAMNNSATMLREGVSIIASSRSNQPSVEVGGGGLFTSLVVDALEGGAADLLGNVTIPAIYARSRPH